jgi:hypothetical protein
MRAGLSFSYPPISLLLRQPLSIKKSYAGAIQYHLKFLFREMYQEEVLRKSRGTVRKYQEKKETGSRA